MPLGPREFDDLEIGLLVVLQPGHPCGCSHGTTVDLSAASAWISTDGGKIQLSRQFLVVTNAVPRMPVPPACTVPVRAPPEHILPAQPQPSSPDVSDRSFSESEIDHEASAASQAHRREQYHKCCPGSGSAGSREMLQPQPLPSDAGQPWRAPAVCTRQGFIGDCMVRTMFFWRSIRLQSESCPKAILGLSQLRTSRLTQRLPGASAGQRRQQLRISMIPSRGRKRCQRRRKRSR